MNLRIVLAYAAMCSIWGTTWLAIKVALLGLPPLAGAGARFIIAGIFLYGLGAIAGERRGAAPPLKLVLVLALTLFGANYALTYYAETGLASGLVAVLFGTLPFFMFGLAAVMLGERVSWRTLAGAVLALGGVAAISISGNIASGWTFVLATLLAAFSSAFANVYLKRYAMSDPFRTLAPAMLLAGIVMFGAGAQFERVDWHAAASPSSLTALGYLAIFGSGIAFYLNHWLLQRLESWVVGLSALVIPIIAVAVGVVAGGELLTAREIVGTLLVIGGVWIAISRGARPELALRR